MDHSVIHNNYTHIIIMHVHPTVCIPYMQDRREYNAWKSELETADFGVVGTIFIRECTCILHMAITTQMSLL